VRNEEAKRLAVEYRQEAYFSLHEDKSIYVRALEDSSKNDSTSSRYDG
jgi:hypothetical protein